MFFNGNYRNLMIPSRPANCGHIRLWRTLCISVADSDQLLPTTVQSNCQVSLTRINLHPFTTRTSISRIFSAGSMQFSFYTRECSRSVLKQLSASLLLDHIIEEETQIDSTLEYLENLGLEMKKEAERRRKIGLARKGKVPWNKGRKHSAETRALIKNRTREAVKDPKVRKRMFERQSHAHSTDTRAKMVMGQKRSWKKRYKTINNRNKFICTWGDCIAESAKQGLFDQQKLEWDSYDKMAAEIALQQLQLATERENATNMAKLMTAEEKAERRAIQRKEKEEQATRRREEKIKLRLEAKKAKEELQIARKLKAKITKIRRRKIANNHVTMSADVATEYEKLDLESIQREKSGRKLSLADQIQAAKQKRSESAMNMNGHATMTTQEAKQVDLDLTMKREKPRSLLSFTDQILAAKKKRAESAATKEEALNGQVAVGEEEVTASHQPSPMKKPDLDLMRMERVQRMSSFADQIRVAKQKRAEEAAARNESVNGQVSIKEVDSECMKTDKVRGMLSFANQIRAAKQRRAEESAVKGH